MITYDEKLLDDLTDDEFRLSQIVARFLNQKTLIAFPSVEKLQSLTGWGEHRLRRARQALTEKGIYSISPRFTTDGRRSSNEWKSLGRIRLFIGKEQTEDLEEQVLELQRKVEDLEEQLKKAAMPPDEWTGDTPDEWTGDTPDETAGDPTKAAETLTKTPPDNTAGDGYGSGGHPRQHSGGHPRQHSGGKSISSIKSISLTNLLIPSELNDTDFLAAFNDLLTQKKWRRKSETACNLALQKLAKYPPAFATELVENAILGDYQGVVFPDTPEAFKKWQRQQLLKTQENEQEQQTNQGGYGLPRTNNGFDQRTSESFNRTIQRIKRQRSVKDDGDGDQSGSNTNHINGFRVA